MIPLRANTAFTERVGPFLDETDGHTPETGLTIVRADCQLSKNGGAFAQKDNTGGGTHDTDGWYSISGATTDVDTKGRLKLQIDIAGALPVWVEFLVVEENIYDMLFSNNHDFILKPQSIDFDGGSGAVPAINLKGGDTAAAAIVLESDTDVIHQTCKTAGGNVLVATAGSSAGDCWQLNSPADAGKALDLNGGPVTGKGLEVDGGGADIDAQELIDILADTAEIGTAGAGLTDLGGMSTGMKAEVQGEVDDALLAYDEAAGVASAAALATVDGIVDDILVDTDEMQGKLPTNNIMGSSVKTDKDDEIDAVKAKTDNLPADPASDTNVDAVGAALSAEHATLQGEHLALSGEHAAIQADTDDLQTQIGTAGAGLTDLGGMSTGMKAEVESEATDALNAYDPPTKAELDTAEAAIIAEVDANEVKIDAVQTTADAIEVDTGTDLVAQIGALNNLSQVQAEAACDAALATYDGPTDAEMVARTLVAASYFDPAADTVALVTEVGQLGAQAKLDVNAEADTALTDYDGPTHAELKTELMEKGFDQAVLTRHANNKPKTFHVGSGADRMKVTTTQDLSGDTDTQTYAADPV